MWLVVAFPTAMLAMLLLLALVEDRLLARQPRPVTPPKPAQQAWRATLVPAGHAGRHRRTEVHLT